jgi:hypothetical protein
MVFPVPTESQASIWFLAPQLSAPGAHTVGMHAPPLHASFFLQSFLSRPKPSARHVWTVVAEMQTEVFGVQMCGAQACCIGSQ